MSFQLVAYKAPINARALKIVAAAKYAGVAVEVTHSVEVDCEAQTYKNNCHPLGRNPVLQTEEGYLFESNAILRHVARCDKNNSFLYGRSTFEAGQVDMWLDYAMGEIDGTCYPPCLMAAGILPKCEESMKAAAPRITEAFAGVDSWLETRTFLVGERVTIADIAIAASTHFVLSLGQDLALPVWEKKNVVRHYKTMMAQPNFAAGIVALGGEAVIPEKAKEEKKPAAAPAKPKEEKKPAAAAPAHDDDDEDAMPEEPKAKNPLDALPPSPFVLDAFKREYSNKDTRTEAAPYFFTNFDNAGWTVWTCKYKYNEDLKMQFMTANLIRGWFQRMEGCRKYAFGCAIISGTDTKHEITALWVLRGKGFPECVKEVEDSELFDWTEIADPNSAKDLITDYFAWEGATFKQPVLEGRTFK